jgi:hypothetical protein
MGDRSAFCEDTVGPLRPFQRWPMNWGLGYGRSTGLPPPQVGWAGFVWNADRLAADKVCGVPRTSSKRAGVAALGNAQKAADRCNAPRRQQGDGASAAIEHSYSS